MKKGLRISLIVAAFVLLGAICFVVGKQSRAKRMQTTCSGLRVEYADPYRFVSAKDIERYLKNEYGAYIGQRLDSVNLKKVEDILNSKSAVLRTEAYTTHDGNLNVKLYQREPIVRFQTLSGGYYADERGFIFPLQHSYTSTLPIIDGNIPLKVESGYKGEPKTKAEKEWLSQIVDLVKFLNSSKNWSENISQITVDRNGDLIMIPRIGQERFIFGQPTDIEEKFSKMEKYYSAIIPEKGKDYYKTVDLKYNGQIICRTQ